MSVNEAINRANMLRFTRLSLLGLIVTKVC